jgi:hypothetical protein
MTNDVVAGSSQGQSKDIDQSKRKRSAPKDVEEELTKKRIRDNANAQLPEAAGGESSALTTSLNVVGFITLQFLA